MGNRILKNPNLWAGVSFLVGLLGLQLYLSRLETSLAGGNTVAVLVATRQLAAGQAVEETDVGSIEIPEAYLDERRIRFKERSRVMGVELATDLKPGDSLVWSDLVAGSAHRQLAQLVKPGQRAYALKRAANPLGKLLQVGDRVDILLQSGPRAETLLERVVVLAVGTKLHVDQEERPNDLGVTVSVTPSEAETLQAADARGKLFLVLRNANDQRLSHSLGVSSELDRSLGMRGSPGGLPGGSPTQEGDGNVR